MRIDRALELLEIEDSKYGSMEDKNYYLVHKYNDILKEIAIEDLKILQNIIFKKYKHKDYKSFLEYVCAVSEHNDFGNKNTYKTEITNSNAELPKSILDFYENYDYNMILFIKGHLFIEYYMKTVIKKINVRMGGFYNKIQILFNHNLIDNNMKDLLEKINKTRNDIAHEIKYKLRFDTVFELVNLSVLARVDYSDDTIYTNKKLSYEWYGIEGILNELFPNTIYAMLDSCKELFTDDELNEMLY